MIVVAGEALIDLLIFPDGSVKSALGGGPFNAARTVARLGHRCRFVGRLSVDRFGSCLAAALGDDGVELAVGARSSEPTTLAAAELDPSGSASYRFYLAGTSAPSLLPEHLPSTEGVDAVHVGSLALVLQPMSTTLLDWVCGVAPGVLVMVDLNCRPLASSDHDWYRRQLRGFSATAHVVKASTEDLDFLFPGDETERAARRLLDDGARVVLLTDGGRPVRVVTTGAIRTVPVQPVEVIDTVGAGDTFGAGFLTWWIESGRGVDALEDLDAVARATGVGTAVSAITCSRAGADPPRRTELRDW